MIRNPLLDETRSSIHSRPIPWKGLNRANVVTEEEVQSFETLGRLSGSERVDLVQQNAAKYAEMLVQLFSKDIRDDLVKYLVLFVVENGSAAPKFAQSIASHPETFGSLNKMLTRKDEQISILAAVSISTLASTSVLAPVVSLEALYKYIIQNFLLATKPDLNYKDLGTQLLVRVLQDPRYRDSFLPFESEAVPAVLAQVASAPLQLQYHSLLVLWVLSFDKNQTSNLLTVYSISPVILDSAKTALKEKIVRVSVAILANLVRFDPKQSIPILIAEGTLSTIRLLEARKWNDEELQADLQYLKSHLTNAFESMTTFEEYSNELNARKLRWTPVHKNSAFWIENIDEFKTREWSVLKQLVHLVAESNDAVTLAVACHDIASVVDQAPEATQVITQIGGKTRLMELIAYQDTEVRFEALKATQKIISHILV